MTVDFAIPGRRPLLWWNLATAAVIVFLVVVAVFEARDVSPHWPGRLPETARTVVLTAPAILTAILYGTLGRRTLRRAAQDAPLNREGRVFLVLLLAVLAFGVVCLPMYATLQALVYPIVWSVVEQYRTAVLWNIAVAVVVGAGIYVGRVDATPEAALITSLVTAPVSLIFSVAMGTWITHIHGRGEAYRELAEQLRQSQDEVARLSTEAGAAAERERMSHDLHDTLTQTLAGLMMLSEQAERTLEAGNTDRARLQLARVTSAARTAVSEARALVATTQPLGDDGLVLTLRRIAAGLEADTGLEVVCHLTEVSLPREREVILLRTAQEGLANARKHARASRVTLSLTAADDGTVQLRVDDNGVGPGGARMGGFGISGLSSRVRALGGGLTFGARTGGGSRLEVTLPRATTHERSTE